MSKWEMVRLGDVCNILSGYAFNSGYFTENDLDFPLIRIRDVIRGYTNTYYSEKYDEKYIIKNGDLLIGMDGEFNISEWKGQDALLNQRVCKITPVSNLLEKRYMLFFLPKALKKIEHATPFVTVKHLSTRTISQIHIPLPSFEIQKKIAQTLDTAAELIALRKKQLAELDNLIKATFYDMFGDPVVNEKGWEVSSIADCAEVETGSTPLRSENSYYDNGTIPWIKTGEVNGSYIRDAEEYITQKAVNETNCKIMPKNTILVAMYGQGKTRGMVGLLKLKATTNQACAAIIPGNTISSEYLLRILKFSYTNLRELGRGGNQPNLNLSIVKNFTIPIPPIECQNQFAEIVTKIEEQKALVQKAIDESQYLFDSLMSQYFE